MSCGKLMRLPTGGARARGPAQDQASKDTRSAASSGRPDDDSASPLTPALSRLPPRARGGLLTAVWAVGTIGVSSTSYIATRTSGNLADCANEHGINTILTVRAPYIRIGFASGLTILLSPQP